MSHPFSKLALAPLLALLLAPLASAQLDLPDKGGKDTTPAGLKNGKAGNIAPHLTCTVCLVSNYTTAIQYDAKNGMQKAYCASCQTARLHTIPKKGKGKRGRGLDLPGTGRTQSVSAGEALRAVGAGGAAPSMVQDTLQGGLSRAAEEILIALESVDSVDDDLALQAQETLLSLGDPGRVAARLALASDHAPKMLTGVRVLLRTGQVEDAEAVVSRVRRRMPRQASSAALAELVELDPVRATPRLFCELLDHPQQPVRAAAHRRLRDLSAEDVIPHLVTQLSSKRSDARMRSIDLIAGSRHPLSRDLLLTRLADPRAKVARRVIEALAVIDDPELNSILLTTTFQERWVLRRGAYALLALIEREDMNLEPVLNEAHVDALMRGLDSSDPFVSGACASALAGIGFRSESAEVSTWLDQAVPERLVQVVSGFEFFDDYEALREPALRRLKMVTGTTFGADGPAWAEWWLAGRETFVASRAVIPILDGDGRRLSLSLADRSTGEAFVLLGPDLVDSAPVDRGEVFYLGEEESEELLSFLEGQGLFGLDRLPGARGSMTDLGRVVDVRLGERGKAFVYGVGAGEAWFDHVVGRAQALAERNYWQRFPDPEVHADRLALFRAEGAWWGGDHDAATRDARLKTMVLTRAARLAAADREQEVLALEHLYETAANIEAQDFLALTDLLREERWFSGRARRLARLARQASGLNQEAPTAEVNERLWLLVDALHETFSADAMPELGDLVAAAGHDFARVAAADVRPILRAVSAHTLADNPSDEDLSALDELLRDQVVDVEVAAVEAVGRRRLETLRAQILLRSRLGQLDVRVAALGAIGWLGGADVRDALTAALAEDDDRLRLAGAQGLANLQDPSTAPMLVSLLRSRNTDGMATIVRKALLDLGTGAHDELFLAMRSPSPELRREAGLLLARQGEPIAAPVLMEALASNPVDAEVGRELAILTSVDLREKVDPAEAWFRWWDTVKHSNSLAWLRASAETHGVSAPAAEAFVDGGNRDAIGFLVEVMRLEEEFLAERGRRALEQLRGREVGDLPPHGASRDAWLVALLEVLDEQQR